MLRVRATLSGWNGGPGLMTWYAETPLQDAAAALRIVTNVRARLAATWGQLWTTGISANVSGDVDVIDAATGLITDTLSVAAPATAPGLTGSALAPPATALQLRLLTATFVAGRRVQGRQFFSPLTSTLIQTDGTPSSTALAILAQGQNDLTTNWASGDFQVVWHRPKAGAGGVAARVTGHAEPDKFAVLTSRRD